MNTLITFAQWLRDRFGIWLYIFTPLLGMVAWVLTSLDTINAALDDTNSYLDSLQASLVNGLPQIASVWQMARYFFPVDLALVLTGFLLVLTVLAAGIRILKSFIPTLT